MRKIIILFTLISFFSMNAQYDYGTLHFKDSTSQKGFIKQRNYRGIKFKANEESKPINYDHKLVTGFEISNENFFYVIEDIYKAKPQLMKLLVDGKTKLYEHGYNTTVHYGGSDGTMSSYHTKVTKYYISKGDKVVDLGVRLSKRHYTFFNNCPELMKKIKSKEIKRGNLIEIVKYQNENCN